MYEKYFSIKLYEDGEPLLDSTPIYCFDKVEDNQIIESLDDFEYKQFQNIIDQDANINFIKLFDNEASISKILFINNDPFKAGELVKKLAKGKYHFELLDGDRYLAILSMVLGSYKFDKYQEKKFEKNIIELVLPSDIDSQQLRNEANAVAIARNLINEPTNKLGTLELAEFARELSAKHKANFKVIEGEQLEREFPLVYAVGMGSQSNPPLVLEINWSSAKSEGQGNEKPLICLVGKGVCFDSGGLGIKPASGMALMKKDMGGAANILALADLIMAENLDVDLKIVIPTVENAISGTCFRPGDIFMSRCGLTVEIGHTDAEGRLILADALTYVAEERKPDLLIDIATLTGAARTALGPKIVPFYSTNSDISHELMELGEQVRDDLWHMPLYQPYAKKLKSKVADLNNITGDVYAGSITAALFLQKFVEDGIDWLHFDIFGWNLSEEAHCPVGGEAQSIRAIFSYLKKKYSRG